MRYAKLTPTQYGLSLTGNIPYVISCAPHSLTGTHTFVKEFMAFLATLETSSEAWNISFLGPLVMYSVLGVLVEASDQNSMCAYWMSNASKQFDVSPGFAELSVAGDLTDYRRFLTSDKVDPKFDLTIGGWLVPRSHRFELMPQQKFPGGKIILQHPHVAASFISADDFNHIIVIPQTAQIFAAIEALKLDFFAYD